MATESSPIAIDNDSDTTGLRWFKLNAVLAEFGHAAAFKCRWNRTDKKWVPNEVASDTRQVYSTIEGVEAEDDDYVLCLFNSKSRIWEVVNKTCQPPS